MESELGTGLNRQNPRNERVVDLIHMGDTRLRLSCIGGIGQPLPREINDRVRRLERLIGGNRGKGDPAGNAAGLPIIRFGPTSGDEEQQTRKARYEEKLSGAGTNKTPRIHLVVPAHIGKAAYHLAAKEYEEAIRIGEAGLAIAENSGFIIWAAHRLLPLIGEAYLQIHDTDAGVHIEERMLRYGKKLNTRSGLAWLSAYEAVKVWYSGDIERGTVFMRKAAEDLEEVPMIYDAARLRRQLAGRLADLGKRDAALEELRRVHDVFQRIGAKPELKKTRGMFRELDTRPPSTSQGKGAEALSQRELEIARLVARRKSNKAIAKALGISPRTVSTHLSNAFQKLEIGSRGELADYARDHSLLSSDAEE